MMKMTKKEMIKDLEDFGLEKINMLDESFNQIRLGILLACEIAVLEEMDGRNKKNLEAYLNKAKTVFSKAYEDVVNKKDEDICLKQ